MSARTFPPADLQLPWDVEARPSPGGPILAVRRNGVVAHYNNRGDSAADLERTPLPGRHPLRGRLFGTRHGGTDHDLFPVTSATVTRIQVVSRELRQGEHVPTAVPGSTQLLDVRRSARWFSRQPPGPVATVPMAGDGGWRRRVVPAGLVYRVDVGVLLTISDTPDTLT